MLIALRAAAKRLGDQMDLLRHLPVGWNLAGCSRFSKCHLWKVGYLCADDVDAEAHNGDPTTTDFRYHDKNGGTSRVRTRPGGFEYISNGTAPPIALLRRLRPHSTSAVPSMPTARRGRPANLTWSYSAMRSAFRLQTW